MSMLKRLLIAGSAALALAAVLPAFGVSAAPVNHGRDHFTSDPYATELCGIPGLAVDTVVAQFLEKASGATVETANVSELFTATASGKSIEWRMAGVVRRSPLLDNGDGTATFLVSVNGTSAIFKLPNGSVLGADVGSITFAVTLDAVTGDFISFEVVDIHGPRPPGCDAIVAALT
jgi:hypothetical protein